MSFVPVTTLGAAILAFVYFVLTARVVAARGRHGASLGDGGQAMIASGEEHTVPLLVACRTHANFAEYVPLALILIGLNESAGMPRWFVCAVMAALVAGRVLHPIGMGRRMPNPYRMSGIVLTLSAIGAAAIGLFVRLLA